MLLKPTTADLSVVPLAPVIVLESPATIDASASLSVLPCPKATELSELFVI